MLLHVLLWLLEGNGTPLQYSCLENPMNGRAWWAVVHGLAKSLTWPSEFAFTFHFYVLEKEMATHSSVLAWRIPGTADPSRLPSMGSHRVRHDWSDLAAAAKVLFSLLFMWLKPSYSPPFSFSVTFLVRQLVNNVSQPVPWLPDSEGPLYFVILDDKGLIASVCALIFISQTLLLYL